MQPTLFVVATPIGNLEDITLRALRVLGEVDLIAAEDTRRTAKLLARHGLRSPMLSFHEHNVRERVPRLIRRLREGASIALVTDAGTPGISDPGAELVRACLAAGFDVDPIPGPSASLAAAVASGFPLVPLTIFGFPPRRSKDRSVWISTLTSVGNTLTFFESPHRVARTLGEVGKSLGERPIMVARELTKVHQEFLRGTADEVAASLTGTKGEITVVIGPRPVANNRSFDRLEPARPTDVITVFGQMIDSGASRRAAILATAKQFGKSARDVYALIERAKSQPIDQ